MQQCPLSCSEYQIQDVNIVLDLVVHLDCEEKKKLGIALYVKMDQLDKPHDTFSPWRETSSTI